MQLRCVVFFGGAGAGKTRLAIEACEAAEAAGWCAGFVPSAELARFHATQNLVHWVLDKNVLLVVDYAATSLPILKDWFATLAPERHRREGGKLRVLLLERQADPQSGWWAELTRLESADRAGPADLIGENALFALEPLGSAQDKRHLLAETMRSAAPLLDPPAPVQAPPEPGTDAWFDTRLADHRIGNKPLYLMMAGIYAARFGAVAALALDHLELAGKMAQIETARLEKFALARGFADNGEVLKHLAACITLQNGCPIADLAAFVEAEMAALRLTAPFSAMAVAQHLCDCLPSPGASIEPVRPDLIGEAFLLPIIRGGKLRSADDSQAIVGRAYRREGSGTVDTLVRCAQDFAQGSADHEAVSWLRNVVEAADDPSHLPRIAGALPASTLSLRELALDVYLKLAAIDRVAAAADSDTFMPDLAGSLTNLANRLSDLGRREEALAAADEAVQLYRALVAARPDAFTHDLAMSLNSLAKCLSHLGRREAALAMADEAVQLRRALVAARPDASTPNLAASLNDLANFLDHFGRLKEALAAAAEAVQLYRALAAARPDVFTRDLAMSLNSLANCLSHLGRREAALAAADKAVQLYRALDVARPDAFTPNLAGSLNNLANRLCHLGRCEEALAAAEEEEAVQLRRALAAARPDAFTPDLAMSLSVLADILALLDRVSEAIPIDEEAIRSLTPYFLQRPVVFARAITSYGRNYICHCKDADREIDVSLLQPSSDMLQHLSTEPE